MSDIRFNQWLHQSGTGGVSQSDGGHVGIGTTNPLLPVGAGNTHILHVGVVTSNSISAGSSITATTFYGSGANLTGITAGLSNIVEDTSPQLGGNLDTNSHNIYLDDDHKVIFGNTISADLHIFHESSSGTGNIYNATGELRIRSNDIRLKNLGNSETYLKAQNNGAVELYYDNNLRLQTWSDAVNILGNNDADAILHLYADRGDNNADKWMLRAESSVSRFSIENYSTGSWVENIRITAGNMVELKHADGTTRMQTDSTGITVTNRITAGGDSNTYMNLGPNDIIDLYTGGTNLIRMDASGRLLIGTTTEGNSSADDLTLSGSGEIGITIRSTNSSQCNLFFSDGTSGAAEYAGVIRYDHANNYMSIWTNGDSEKVRIASDGEVFIGDNYGGTNRSTLLSISGANQNPTGVWTQVGVYSNDSVAQDKGGSIGFGGHDGSVAQQQFSAIKGAKENGNSGDYAGYLAVYTRPSGSVSQERVRIKSNGVVDINGMFCAGKPGNFGSVSSTQGCRITGQQGSHPACLSFDGGGTPTLELGSTSGQTIIGTNGYGGSPMNFKTGMAIATLQGGTTRFQINTNGNIGAPTGNNIYNASDERLKENMVELTDGLSKIQKLKPISFTWKEGWDVNLDGKKEYGFGAQTTEVVDEMLVEPFSLDDAELNGEIIEKPLRVNEKYIIPLLVKAVQELSAKVAALEGS